MTIQIFVLACETGPPTSFCSCPKSPSLFFFTACSYSTRFLHRKSSQKKHRRENERQKRWRAESLRGEGPIKRTPFSLQRMCPEMEGDERSKKNSSLFFLKIEFCFTLRGRLTGRQVGEQWRRRAGCFKHKSRWKKSFGRIDCVMETHYMHCTPQLTNTQESRFNHQIQFSFPLIDSFHHFQSHKIMFCALVNKYFSYLVLFPPPQPVCPPFQSTCQWFTHYMSHSRSPCWNLINVGPKFKQKNDIWLFLCCATRALFSFILLLSIKLFARFGKCAGIFSCSAFKSTSPLATPLPPSPSQATLKPFNISN